MSARPASHHAASARSWTSTETLTRSLIAAMVVAGAVVRIWAARGEFWLDEIGSLLLYAQKAHSFVDILASMQDSNNHHLVTLWMYICGPHHGWLVYRVPSILAGVGTTILAAVICRRWGRWEAVVAAGLTSISFFLITYSSEARGYALAGFFALTSLLLLERFYVSQSWRSGLAFGASVMLGFLSSLTFIFGYAGLVAWSVVRLGAMTSSRRNAVRALARCHGPALVGLVLFWWISLRHYLVGGAPNYAMVATLFNALAVSVGGAIDSPLVTPLAAIVAASLGVLGIVWMKSEKSDVWVFFATTVFLAPIVFLASKPSALGERFFYIPIVNVMLVLVYVLGRARRASAVVRALAISALLLIILGNVVLTESFLRIGHGDFDAVIQRVIGGSGIQSGTIAVKTDETFRMGLYRDFYMPRIAPKVNLAFRAWNDPEPTDWVVLNTSQRKFTPPPALTDPGGRRYVLDSVIPYFGFSGLHWVILRRDR